MAGAMKRGDLVIISVACDYGKPRPAVIIQSDNVKATDSILLALLSSTFIDAPIYRLAVKPTAANGLKVPSQIMVDKITAMPRSKCGKVIGRLDDSAILVLNQMISVFVGIAD